MEIRKDTWHYHLWEFTYSLVDTQRNPNPIPEQTDLCSYVRRAVLMPIPILVCWAVLALVGIVFLVVGNAISILFGVGLCWFDEREHAQHPITVVKLFPPLRIGKHNIPSFVLVLLSYAILGLALNVSRGYLGLTGISLLGTIFGVLSIPYLWGRYKDWRDTTRAGEPSTLDLIGEYLKAKKQGICPIIRFVAPDQPEQS